MKTAHTDQTIFLGPGTTEIDILEIKRDIVIFGDIGTKLIVNGQIKIGHMKRKIKVMFENIEFSFANELFCIEDKF